ncbi:MAG: hypothetical protein HKN23_10125 [Verrucomicrobiales bacterium]|nr:hypothetical protein [Verrucomicrobiales bacterium]
MKNGGSATITGANVLLGRGSVIDASGELRGGAVRVGGGFRGNDRLGLRESDSTVVEADSLINVDSEYGSAGLAVVWSNGNTLFQGEVTASSRGAIGRGGLIEISGLEKLTYRGVAHAQAVSGRTGTLLFDPGNLSVGGATSDVPVADINQTLQGGTSVVILTEDGDIAFDSLGQGGEDQDGNALADRNIAIQWTNSLASFGAFAGGNIFVNNHIRTSGRGSINLIAGWVLPDGSKTGLEADYAARFSDFGPPGATSAPALVGDPALVYDAPFPPLGDDKVQNAFDYYVENGQFGDGGSIFIGNSVMTRHVEVGSRYGNTNLAAEGVFVRGSDSNNINRYAHLGFKDSGMVFAPRLNNQGGIILDMIDGSGNWILSDGVNNAGAIGDTVAGVNTPVVAIAWRHEVDRNGDGVPDGVYGVDHTGARTDTFIPYANHFNSASSGNYWWQQIDPGQGQAGQDGSALTGFIDPLLLGSRRPENGAGQDINNRADINVIATRNVQVQSGSGRDGNYAQIGHGGYTNDWGGTSRTERSTGSGDPDAGNFSIAGIERGQLERRWSFNGATNDRSGTAIARLSGVFGNINVLAGVNTGEEIDINHEFGTVTATVDAGGNVFVQANQAFETGNLSSMSYAQIGHGGISQFGEFWGDIHVEATGGVTLLAGTATRSHAAIGHTNNGYSYYNAPDNVDQQLRFFATTTDQRNPNLRRGELYSVSTNPNHVGRATLTTGFDPIIDPPEALNGQRDVTGTVQTGAATNGGDQTDEVIQNPPAGGNVGQPDNATGPYGHDANEVDLGYTGDRGPIDLSLSGVETVEALDGSVQSGFHGDVTVIAHEGNVTVQGANSPANNNARPRDRRFAAIGHGGSNFTQWVDGSGYNGSDPVNGQIDNEDREVVVYEVNDDFSGSRSVFGNIGQGGAGTGNQAERPRLPTFMTITGDISVQAGGNVFVQAGNDIFDYAQIGHGGSELADYETSSFILGDISVTGGGSLLVTGGGTVSHESNRNNFDMRSYGQIGHGGYRGGIMGLFGDIDVEMDGSIQVNGGAYRFNYGMIGHGGQENYAQVGGDFVRNENFLKDNVSIDIESRIDANEAYVEITDGINAGATLNDDQDMSGRTNFFAGTASTTAGNGRNTANVRVVAGGNITLDHLPEGVNINDAQLAANRTEGSRTGQSWSQIGHGGIGEDALNENNAGNNFGDKVANIYVEALDGDITLNNGGGGSISGERSTRIGHGFVSAAGNSRNPVEATELVGDITVIASGNITVDATAGGPNGNPLNGGITGIPSQRSPVVIGHGGITDLRNVVVLSDGEDVHGIAASSDISVTAGNNMSILGGAGGEAPAGNGTNVFRGSFAQVGHGFSSRGDDRAGRNGVPTGFNGDITVNVTNDLRVEGNPLAAIDIGSLTGGQFISASHGFAAIGNGGVSLDAPATGDIGVYVGNNLDLIAQQRTQGVAPSAGGSGNVASAGNFAKIGHVAFEDNLFDPRNNNDVVLNSNHSGDITVVVANDFTLRGGTETTGDFTQTGIAGAIAQVGHGGPSISGNLDGDIVVLVQNNLTTFDGAEDPNVLGGNNYVMIGNGDWLRDGTDPLFTSSADGSRRGDISVGVGNTASFQHTLVGHADPAVQPLSSTIDSGDTRIGVSRNFSFFGGTGTLNATEDSIFTSGGYGNNGNMEFYIPSRSLNNLAADNTTRINSASTVYIDEGPDFGPDTITGDPFDPTQEEMAGRDDEIYLRPDLWWDNNGISTIPGGAPFPTSLAEVQGGAIATVDAPGGLPNLQSLNPGDLGDSGSPDYQFGNSVGNYTIFYDAIQPVGTTPPVIPVPVIIEVEIPPELIPLIPFDFFPFLFLDKYDSFDRDDEGLFGLTGLGADRGLYGLLGLEETEEGEEEGVTDTERALDDLFGARKDENSEGEEEEEEERVQERLSRAVGPNGVVFYIYDPQGNRYSSLRVFGVNQAIFGQLE